MADNIIYKGSLVGNQLDFTTGSLTDISTFDTDVRASAIENQIVDGVTDRGASQDAIIAMSGALAASAHPAVSAAEDTGLNLSNGNVIQDIDLGFDSLGHVESATFTSVNLDNRYYQKSEVTGISGALQSQITSNDSDILALQGATGTLNTNLGSAESDIDDLQTSTGDLNTRLGSAEGDIDKLQTSTGDLNTRLGTAETDIGKLETSTGDLNTRLTTAEGEIDSLQVNSGNYLLWDIDDVLGAGNTTTKDIKVGDITGTTLRVTDGSITGPATITIDPDSAGAAGTVVIQGDLQVEGTTTTINSTEVQVGDKSLILGTGASNDAAMDGGGLILSGTAGTVASFLYDNSSDEWQSSNQIYAATFRGALNGNASTATKWANARTITLGGDLGGSVSIDGNADKTLTATIQATSVEGSMLALDSVSGVHIADDQIDSEHYVDGSVDNVHLANSSITVTAGTGVLGGATVALGGTVRLDLKANTGIVINASDELNVGIDNDTIGVNGSNQIYVKANGISSDEIANGAVDTDALGANAVTNAKMAANSVDSDQYVDGSIDLIHLSADSVDGTKIADDSIDSEHIADGAVDNVHLANSTIGITAGSGILGGGSISLGSSAEININTDNATLTIASDTIKVKDAGIGSTQLAGDAVNGDKIADDAINSEHIADGAVDNVHLANSSITVAAGDGLAGGTSALALGSSRTLTTASDQSHLNEIELGTDNAQITGVVTKGGTLILRGTAENGITLTGASSGNAITLEDNSTVAFEGIVQIVDTGAADSEDGAFSAMFKIQGVIRRDADSNVTMLASQVTKVWAGSSASAYAVSVGSSSTGLQINGNLTSGTFDSEVVTSCTLSYNAVKES